MATVILIGIYIGKHRFHLVAHDAKGHVLRGADHWVLLTEQQAELPPVACRLMTVPGIGVITASQLAADAGNAKGYGNVRHFAASLGLVPRQHATGGRQKLLGISRRQAASPAAGAMRARGDVVRDAMG